MRKNTLLLTIGIGLLVSSCSKKDNGSASIGKNINTATKVSIDRFSNTAGHLMVRNATNGLPTANAPINFDQTPFITKGLDKNGTPVFYYNFDVQPSNLLPPVYVFFNEDGTQVKGQNNILGVIPGDAGYSDFWLLTKVIVPSGYIANSITSESAIISSKYTLTKTTDIINCPVVPFGSTATRSKTASTSSELHMGWYKDMAVAYFIFDESALHPTGTNSVPTSPIYVMFNDDATGPSSGFRTEPGTIQTHNVIATSPGDGGYSPLWDVQVISNVSFPSVNGLTSAQSQSSKAAGATVNCPVVK